MNEFERPLPPFRIVETHFGDTLQDVAAREMGDANRWPELVWINALKPPYITDDPSRVTGGVFLSGAFVKVPAPGGWQGSGSSERGRVYERDCRLSAKRLQVGEGGDLDVVTGADNLRQQLQHRVATPRGQLMRHPEYGCLIYRLLGTKITGAASAKLGAEYVKSAMLADYRVRSVDFSLASISGDVIRVSAKATAIEGGVVDVVQGV